MCLHSSEHTMFPYRSTWWVARWTRIGVFGPHSISHTPILITSLGNGWHGKHWGCPTDRQTSWAKDSKHIETCMLIEMFTSCSHRGAAEKHPKSIGICLFIQFLHCFQHQWGAPKSIQKYTYMHVYECVYNVSYTGGPPRSNPIMFTSACSL